MHVGAIHDVQGPQLWVLHVEILDHDVAYIPEHERHWTPRLSEVLLRVIPSVAVAIDATSSIPIDPDAITSDDEPGMVILKCYRVRVVAPVCEVRRELGSLLVSGHWQC